MSKGLQNYIAFEITTIQNIKFVAFHSLNFEICNNDYVLIIKIL